MRLDLPAANVMKPSIGRRLRQIHEAVGLSQAPWRRWRA
jgi:hypothetical protein